MRCVPAPSAIGDAEIGTGTIGCLCGTLVRHSSAVRGGIVAPAFAARSGIHVAVQQDPYFALPSLYGAPAYSRPPRPPVEAPRPIDPDDLPISTQQTGEERRLAEALFASRSFVPAGVAGLETPGSGDPGYQAANGQPLSLIH